MPSPVRLLTAAVLALTVTVTGATGTVAGTGEARGPDRSPPPQTSDGLPGEIALPLPPWLRGRVVVTDDVTTPVAAGVDHRTWTRTDARGPVRVHLLTVDPGVAGVRVDYTGTDRVRARAKLRRLVARDGGVAGVNGDFFDIGDTFAPLGNGQDRERGLLHGRRSTWTTSFWITRRGVARIGDLRLRARIDQHPRWRLHHVNSPTVWPDRIGLYTPAWGDLAGARVTDGQRHHVREVVVRGGIVRANRPRLTRGEPVRGLVLVGRGRGADRLAKLRVGSRADVSWRFPGRPPVAISGSEVLLRAGEVTATDDRALHPRTAIGIDRDSGRLLLVVVDGRQEHSRGMTLVELATLLRDLGAEAALNLDGGGSSTMVGRLGGGDLSVLNSPSDGTPRRVPNGLVVYADPLPAD